MKLIVDQDVCIGCGACQATAPEVFEINDDGLAEAIVEEVPEELNEDALDALEGCPVSAIVEAKDDEEKETNDEEKETNDEEKETNDEEKEAA